jgi:Tfp pilus assembly protein PilN
VKGTLTLTGLEARASHVLTVAAAVKKPVAEILTFSLADKRIWPGNCLSVCIQRGSVSVTWGKRSFSRIRVKDTRVYPFEKGRQPQPEGVASSVALAKKEMGASVGDVTLSIPRSWVVIRRVELPLSVRENLTGAVAFELDRLTPFAAEDALYDFKVIEESRETLTILIAASRAEVVTPYIRALADRGINVNRITFDLSAAATFCTYPKGTVNVAFIDIRSDGYEGSLSVKGSMVAAWSDVFNDMKPEAKLESLSAGIARMREIGAMGINAPPVFVSLDDEDIDVATLKTRLPSVKVLVGLDARNLSPPSKGESLSPGAAGAILESLWPKAQGFNLLDRGFRKKTRMPRSPTIILLFMIAAAALLYAITPFQLEQRRVQEIGRQIALIKPEVKKVEGLKKEVETLEREIALIEGFKTGRPMTLNMLKELTTILPKNAWLSRTRITDTAVDLEGYAGSATELMPKLDASKYFKKVEFGAPTFKDTRFNADRFVIKMEVEDMKAINEGGGTGG